MLSALTMGRLQNIAVENVRTIMEHSLETQRELLRAEIAKTCKDEVMRANTLLAQGRTVEARERLNMIQTLVARMDTL